MMVDMTQCLDRGKMVKAMTIADRISVIVPVYNQEKFLTETIESALHQTYKNLEIILINDGSNDRSARICDNLSKKDERIRYYSQDNRGVSFTRNRAIQLSQGAYIAPLDADDLWEPDYLIRHLEVFQKKPLIGIVYCCQKIIDEEGNEVGETRPKAYLPNEFLARMLFRNDLGCPSTLLIRRECFNKHQYNEDMCHGEDYDLNLRLAEDYIFEYLDLPLTYYRRHEGNVSNNLLAHRKAESIYLSRYTSEMIRTIVEKTRLGLEEKKMLEGKILLNQEKFQEAIVLFKKSQHPLAYFYLGNCYLARGFQEEAISIYEQALKINPEDAASLNNLGVLLAYQGCYQEARDCFQKALAMRPELINVKFNLDHLKDSIELKVFLRELRSTFLPYKSPLF